MPVDLARSLLPEDTIIGLSVSNVKEAQAAADSALVDYVGIGAVWWTGSKDLKGKLCLGVDGVGEVLDILAEAEKRNGKVIKSVAIGESFATQPVNHPLTLSQQVESIFPTSLNYCTAVPPLNTSKASTASPSYPTSSLRPIQKTQHAVFEQCWSRITASGRTKPIFTPHSGSMRVERRDTQRGMGKSCSRQPPG